MFWGQKLNFIRVSILIELTPNLICSPWKGTELEGEKMMPSRYWLVFYPVGSGIKQKRQLRSLATRGCWAVCSVASQADSVSELISGSLSWRHATESTGEFGLKQFFFFLEKVLYIIWTNMITYYHQAYLPWKSLLFLINWFNKGLKVNYELTFSSLLCN